MERVIVAMHERMTKLEESLGELISSTSGSGTLALGT
jgi:hypothetical protein